ncbi:GNAT family N-acetyltransferase [Geodermatophilus sp. YIM 151500]|uniref:GNAT family N-acetyltransferase n=1 Tax=Geodermatophilus sp. YIM 151500 TaxID=2984531 RepID=UPI0021E3D6C2|nr:GNAT family N-acetyltransferase [Geodermatophilus sp. YIM 151500]MCV2489549.1 GNAT family N-acetyltransferase [Geodermatophilus sp. YIM 151500]
MTTYSSRPGPAAVAVRPVTTAADARDAEQLLDAQRRWLRSIGIEVADAQPTASGDYDDPAAYYAPPDGALLVARLGDVPVGLVGVCRLAEPPGERAGELPEAAELRRMFVLDRARGHGAGRRLLAGAIDAARRLGVAELWLETVPAHMAAAARMYASAGFRPAPPLGHTHLPGTVTLRLRLRPAADRPAPRRAGRPWPVGALPVLGAAPAG